MGLFNFLFGSSSNVQSSTTSNMTVISRSTYIYDENSALSDIQDRLRYLERIFNNDDYGNIYRISDSYKNIITSPIYELLRSNNLKYIEYSNDDFYLGQTESNRQRDGIGLYSWAWKKDSAGNTHISYFIGEWRDGQHTTYGTELHFSNEDEEEWYHSCQDGFYISPIGGVER